MDGKRRVLGAWVLVAAFGVAPISASNGRAVLRLVGGVELEVSGAVERRHGLLVFRTVDGVLVSVPEERVVTMAEGFPGQPEPDPEPGTVSAASEVYTNADLPPPPVGYVPPPPGKFPDAARVVEPPLTYDAYRDRDGHGESWWRERAEKLDREVRMAGERVEREVERWRELDAIARAICPATPPGYFGGRCAAILGEVGEARRRAAEAVTAERVAREARSVLEMEAARAGALPGWLR